MMARFAAAAAAIYLGFAGIACAGETDISGRAEAELRAFPHAPQFISQFETWQPSIALEPELRWQSEDDRHRFVIRPFIRIDSQDSARTHADLREAYYRYASDDDWVFTLGVAHVFWGKAESRHLVDIINQADLVEDVDEEDRLGQPMAHLSLNKSWGQLDLFAMTGFRTRTFPGRSGRLRLDFPVDKDDPIFERERKRGAPDFAARYGFNAGIADIGVSVFHGTSREPRFRVDLARESLIPIYDRITQAGFEGQLTTGPWLLKSEMIVREGHSQTFFATVSGAEYSLYGLGGSGVDLGLVAEYQFDGRDDAATATPAGIETRAPITPFEHALFVGVRLGFNDVQDGAILAGATIDPGDGATVVNLEASRRIGENWGAEVTARLFNGGRDNDVLRSLRRDDFVAVRVSRRF